MVHMGSIFPVGSYTGFPLLKLSFHSMAPKCSQIIAVLAFRRIAGLSDIQSVSSRWWPDTWPVVITMLVLGCVEDVALLIMGRECYSLEANVERVLGEVFGHCQKEYRT